MSTRIELKSFKIDGNLEQAIQEFVNGPANEYEIKGTFGPVTKPGDGFQYMFVLFAAEVAG